MSEQMAYKMQPAGHEEPAPRRKYSEPDRRLCEVFEKWLEKDNDRSVFVIYDSIVDDLVDLQKNGWSPSVLEAHALLLKYQDAYNPFNAGIFTSAMYNLQPEKDIVFDVDLENKVQGLGFQLLKDKILIVNSPTLRSLGSHANGTILNYGVTGYDCGSYLNGLLINYGTAQTFDQAHEEDITGIIINLGIRDLGVPVNRGPEYPQPTISPWICYLIDYTNREKLSGEHLFPREIKETWAQRSERKATDIRNAHIWRHLRKDYDKIGPELITFPELQDYLQKLKEMLEPCKNDHKKALKVIETCSQNHGITLREKIGNELNDIFTRNKL